MNCVFEMSVLNIFLGCSSLRVGFPLFTSKICLTTSSLDFVLQDLRLKVVSLLVATIAFQFLDSINEEFENFQIITSSPTNSVDLWSIFSPGKTIWSLICIPSDFDHTLENTSW